MLNGTPVFIFFMLPETKGRSLEEIDEMFEHRVPVRDFKNYHCMSSETAREIARKRLRPEHTEQTGSGKSNTEHPNKQE